MLSLGWRPMFQRGVIRASFALVAVPVIHPADIADVARVALTEDGHVKQVYELTGPEALILPEQVQQVGAAIGRELAFEEITVEQARDELQQYSPAMVVDYFLKVWTTVPPDVHDAVERLTGKSARTFQQWAHENAGQFR